MADAYLRNRQIYPDMSATLSVAAADTGTKTLVSMANFPNDTLFVQKLHIQVNTGSAGKTWDIRDSNGTPVEVAGAVPVDTAPSHLDLDFGPDGFAITQAKDLTVVLSAAGAAGFVRVEAYRKLTAATHWP